MTQYQWTDQTRLLEELHAIIMHPDSQPDHVLAVLKNTALDCSTLETQPMLVQTWLDRFPMYAPWQSAFMPLITTLACAPQLNKSALVRIKWEWLSLVHQHLPALGVDINKAWREDTVPLLWQAYRGHTDLTRLAGCSTTDWLSVLRGKPRSARYAVADMCWQDPLFAYETSARENLAYALYCHGHYLFNNGEKADDMAAAPWMPLTRAFISWGYNTASLEDEKRPPFEPHCFEALRSNEVSTLLGVLALSSDNADATELTLTAKPGYEWTSLLPKNERLSLADVVVAVLPQLASTVQAAEALSSTAYEWYRNLQSARQSPECQASPVVLPWMSCSIEL